ncbi:ArsR/SmtB family transcription factor [Gracilinema caldarium]|uniref:Transcriptional regulator, ArsR family n=1 Tax=Gracilinema caldarium (strain ATCC 51460 / DSM 7334 / H1) TaxID=744872 RepID=F8F350_GRAC1|nr:metalloregulator ArsR/SmtB family transcription factor [Gracilinema caldarium]AEJ20376.1 transcriptional regulator, ArsR family [Gracilinema caldarium DSM 7334]
MDQQTYHCTCTDRDETISEEDRKLEWPVPRLLALSELFKILADPSRLRILHALQSPENRCVCDLAALLDMSQSALSHQLAILRRARLVRPVKIGKIVYYQLDDHHVDALIALAMEHVSEQGLS